MTTVYHVKSHVHRTFGTRYDREYHALGRFDLFDHMCRYCCPAPDADIDQVVHVWKNSVYTDCGQCSPSHRNHQIDRRQVRLANRTVRRNEEDPRLMHHGLLEDCQVEDNSYFESYSHERERLNLRRISELGWPSVDGSYFKTLGYKRAHQAYKLAFIEARKVTPGKAVQQPSYATMTRSDHSRELRRLDKEIDDLRNQMPNAWDWKNKRSLLLDLIQERKRLMEIIAA